MWLPPHDPCNVEVMTHSVTPFIAHLVGARFRGSVEQTLLVPLPSLFLQDALHLPGGVCGDPAYCTQV